MTILVTGGAGFIGSHFCEALVARGDEVVVVDDLSTGVREHVRAAAKLVVADLAAKDLSELLSELRPSIVVHLAAPANLRCSVTDPVADAQTNVIGSLRLLEACRRAAVRRVLFASSGGAIYGEQERLPTPEDARPRPASPYGVAKLAVEHYLDSYRTVAGIESISMRLGNVYGPRQLTQGEAGVVAIFSELMLRREPVVMFGDGSKTRDYVYVDDVVVALVSAVDRLLSGAAGRPLNIGTGAETSVLSIARQLERALGVQANVEHAPAIAGELERSCLDPARAREDLGWRPRTNLEEGIGRTAAWFKKKA